MENKYFEQHENKNQSFEKGLILVSPVFGAMYKIAKEIADNYKEHEVCWLYPEQCKLSIRNQFNFCNRETKLIVVCGVKKIDTIGVFFNIIANGLDVRRMLNGIDDFNIKPNILLVCDSFSEKSISKKMGGESFDRRFKIFDCDREELKNFIKEI